MSNMFPFSLPLIKTENIIQCYLQCPPGNTWWLRLKVSPLSCSKGIELPRYVTVKIATGLYSSREIKVTSCTKTKQKKKKQGSLVQRNSFVMKAQRYTVLPAFSCFERSEIFLGFPERCWLQHETSTTARWGRQPAFRRRCSEESVKIVKNTFNYPQSWMANGIWIREENKPQWISCCNHYLSGPIRCLWKPVTALLSASAGFTPSLFALRQGKGGCQSLWHIVQAM